MRVLLFRETMDSETNMEKEVTPPKPWHKIRLAPDVRPSEYELWLHPNLDTGVFNGRVTILVNLILSKSYIAVHIKGLEITQSKLTLDDENRTPIKLTRCFEYAENEFWVCETERNLLPDRYRLYFEFEGKLTNKIVGFYRSTYKDTDGGKRHIATTKFEPTFARQAFPCFDEPGFKAIFKIELVKPTEKEFIALSNMAQNKEIADQPEVGLSTVRFDPSHPMSTYLVCFIVCDFKHLESVVTKYDYPVTVYAREEFIDDLKFAREIAVVSAEYFGGYFGVLYPLPKLDLIAIPDFVSGAMENWGLITFRETRLVCDEHNSSVRTQLSVALTVAHEISHMWFGDLVTMGWWNDLWLNEGFATFMEYKAVAHKYPAWELDYIFMETELFRVMVVDATLSSHPIIASVDHPDQITEIFDGISYSKGASIIRMLEITVGEEQFRKGIKDYLSKYRYDNAQTKDLWSQIGRHVSSIDIHAFMDTWTRQMGFPVLNVNVNLPKKEMTITQKRFLSNSNAVYDSKSSPYDYKWEVPITYVTSNDSRYINQVWMHKDEDKITVPLKGRVQWLKVNIRNVGYYVVNYEEWLWKELHEVLMNNTRTLEPGDRASLLFNAFYLAEADQLPYDTALLMIDYLQRETHFLPWTVASTELLKLNQKLFGSDAHAAFKKFIRFLIKQNSAMTWSVDDQSGYAKKKLQNTLLNLGCAVENKTCLGQAATLFKQWLTEPAMKLHPELANMIMQYGIYQTSEKEWDSLWKLYLKEEDPQYKIMMIRALCATTKKDLISRLLEDGKNELFIRSQDYLSVITICSSNPTTNPVVWDFVRKEWPYLVKRYTLNDRYLGHVIPYITSSFSTESGLAQMKEFFNKYPEAGAGANGRKQALERVLTNIQWRQKYSQSVGEWFKIAAAKLPGDE